MFISYIAHSRHVDVISMQLQCTVLFLAPRALLLVLLLMWFHVTFNLFMCWSNHALSCFSCIVDSASSLCHQPLSRVPAPINAIEICSLTATRVFNCCCDRRQACTGRRCHKPPSSHQELPRHRVRESPSRHVACRFGSSAFNIAIHQIKLHCLQILVLEFSCHPCRYMRPRIHSPVAPSNFTAPLAHTPTQDMAGG